MKTPLWSWLLLLSLALLYGHLVTTFPLSWAVAGILGLLFFLSALLFPQAGLHLLILSMLLGPEVVVGGIGRGALLGRGLTLRMDDLLVVLLGLAYLARLAIRERDRPPFPETPLNRPIFAYSAACVLSTALGTLFAWVRPLAGLFFVLKYIEYFVIYFITFRLTTSERDLRGYLFTLFLTAFFASLYGIFQIPSGERVSAPFEGEDPEPNTFGGYLVFMLGLDLGLLLMVEKTRLRWLLGFLALWMVIPLLFTYSRSSYLALLPLLVVLYLYSRRRLVLTYLYLLGAAVLLPLVPESVVDRLLYTFRQPPNPDQLVLFGIRIDSSTSERLRSWFEAISDGFSAPLTPLFGYGVTGYRFLDAQYPRTFVETGLVGLLTFFWLLHRLWRETVWVLRHARDPLDQGLALGFLAGFAALLTHAIGANTFIIVRIMEPFWLSAALLMKIRTWEGGREDRH